MLKVQYYVHLSALNVIKNKEGQVKIIALEKKKKFYKKMVVICKIAS